MRKTGLFAAILLLLSTPAMADCEIDIRFVNDSDWSLTLPLDEARVRTRVGTWHRIWPNAPALVLAPHTGADRTARVSACAWSAFHKFEFSLSREPNCTFQGETVTTNVYQGGGGLSLRRQTDPNAIVFQIPDNGFIRNDQLDPNPGRPPYERDNLGFSVRNLGDLCRAARGD